MALTVNYSKNLTTNVDTASYKYNWYGDRGLLNSPESSPTNIRVPTITGAGWCVHRQLSPWQDAHADFQPCAEHFRPFQLLCLPKRNKSDAIAKETRKNISGVSYRLMPSETWNLSVFGKYYNQFVAGPVATDANQNDYVRTTGSVRLHRVWGCRNLFHPAGTADRALL